jgi:hypothetical protein
MSDKIIGHVYMVRMSVDNKVGTTISDSTVFVLANVPDKPMPPARISDGKILTITMIPPASDGGS